MRNEHLTEEVVREYILDTTDTTRNIEEELEKRLKDHDKKEIEIGSGNGKFIVEHCIERPDVYFVGIEYSYKAVKKTVAKASKRNIKNLTVIYAEAIDTIDKYLKGKYYFDKAYLNFPDPWPKKRHAHRRIFNNVFLEAVHSILIDNGILYVVTDYRDYAIDTMNPILKEQKLFENTLSVDYLPELENYKVTLYEEKMRDKGSDIHFFVYKKV